jgi:predicted ATP-dependent protease
MQDVMLDDKYEDMIDVIAVDTLDEVMLHALVKHSDKAGLVERLEAVIDRLTPANVSISPA